jgi:hypothetical protein
LLESSIADLSTSHQPPATSIITSITAHKKTITLTGASGSQKTRKKMTAAPQRPTR